MGNTTFRNRLYRRRWEPNRLSAGLETFGRITAASDAAVHSLLGMGRSVRPFALSIWMAS